MTHKIIRLLTIIGAIWTQTAKAQEDLWPKPGLTVLAASEQEGPKKNHAEVTLKPEITLEHGEYKVGYLGSFYRSKDSDGSEIDWMTIASEIRAETDTWALDIGRSSTRQYPGYLYTPTTTTFDNQGMIKGTSRTYTGVILSHKETGLSLGQVAQNTQMAPKNWDTTMVGWQTTLSDSWALHLQMTTGRRALSSAGATLKWEATDTLKVVAEGYYLDHEKTGILTANQKVTEGLSLFAGTLVTSPRRGKPEGRATAGMSYDLGKGLQLVLAADQEIGGRQRTSALIGIKYAGNFR